MAVHLRQSMVITDNLLSCTAKKKKTSRAEINENKKVVSKGIYVLIQAGFFKEFIIITETAIALNWKLIKVP